MQGNNQRISRSGTLLFPDICLVPAGWLFRIAHGDEGLLQREQKIQFSKNIPGFEAQLLHKLYTRIRDIILHGIEQPLDFSGQRDPFQQSVVKPNPMSD